MPVNKEQLTSAPADPLIFDQCAAACWKSR